MSALPASLGDEDLMRLVQQDDRPSFEELYRRWSVQVLQFLGRLTMSREQAQDANQETWMRVYRFRQRYDPARPFRQWLYTLAANAGRDARRPRFDDFWLDVEGLVGEDEDRVEKRDRLLKGLRALRWRDRSLLLLRGLGFSYVEIGPMTGLSPATVRKRVSRARKQIRRILDDD